MTGLNRAGFYRWRAPRQATAVEMEVRDEMQRVALESPAYGYRRITAELQHRGFDLNHKRVLRMMRDDNPLLCVRLRAFVVTTDSRDSGLDRFDLRRADMDTMLGAIYRTLGETQKADRLFLEAQGILDHNPDAAPSASAALLHTPA
jgi:transposase InsO family protein